jgi:hypothetical protein
MDLVCSYNSISKLHCSNLPQMGKIESDIQQNIRRIIEWSYSRGTGGGSSPAIKRPGREADHSPPSITEECVALYLHSPIRLHGVVLN